MMVGRSASGLTPTLLSSMEGMITAMAVRDLPTVAHQERVATLAAALADRLELSAERREAVRVAGRLHDIGKLGIPLDIVHAPRPLDAVEMHMMRAHPTIGSHMLRRVGFPQLLCDLVESHHERIDGSGYPYGRSGDELSIECRILGVADTMDAMMSPRAHGGSCTVSRIVRTLEQGCDVEFDGRVVDAATEYLDSVGETAHRGLSVVRGQVDEQVLPFSA